MCEGTSDFIQRSSIIETALASRKFLQFGRTGFCQYYMALQLPYNPHNGAPHLHGNLFQAQVPTARRPFATVVWTPGLPPRSTPIIPRPRQQPFTFFPLLPPELRLKIWSHTLPRRVIEIRSWGSSRFRPIKFSVTPHRLPVIFRICRESRAEALRLYQLVGVGVSAAQLKDGRRYVEWKHHPANQVNSDFTVGTAPLPYAIPYPPVKLYLNYNCDVVYLGPEFHLRHLHDFLTATGAGHELSGVQHIALCHKLWGVSPNGGWDDLRQALFALKTRPVREVIIVPDDHACALEDTWYYRPHEIRLLNPNCTYHFRPNGGERARTVVENLDEWFERMWVETKAGDEDEGNGDGDDESMTLVGDDVLEKEVPKVCIRSIRRNGRTMGVFRDGLWGIQRAMGDMRYWKTWHHLDVPQTS